MSIIKIKNISKVFKSKVNKGFVKNLLKPEYKYYKAVNDITLDIESGECVAFLGPNGAGKTTTTKMLTGLIHPSSGEIEVMGFVPQNRDYDFLRQIGLVMGNKAGLNWDLTAEQSFELISEIYGIDKQKADETLSGLFSILFQDNDKLSKILKTQIRKLSLGERMKMELIASVMHNPRVLFLDEPTIGLDITAKKNIRNFIIKLNKETKTTIILTSHDMDDIEKVCDRVVIINNGSIVYNGKVESLKSTSNERLEDIIERIFIESSKS